MLIQNKPNIVWYEAYITLFMYVFLAFTDEVQLCCTGSICDLLFQFCHFRLI